MSWKGGGGGSWYKGLAVWKGPGAAEPQTLWCLLLPCTRREQGSTAAFLPPPVAFSFLFLIFTLQLLSCACVSLPLHYACWFQPGAGSAQRKIHMQPCTTGCRKEAEGQNLEKSVNRGGKKEGGDRGIKAWKVTAGAGGGAFFLAPERRALSPLAVGANSSCYSSGGQAASRWRVWAWGLEWQGRELQRILLPSQASPPPWVGSHNGGGTDQWPHGGGGHGAEKNSPAAQPISRQPCTFTWE